MSIQIISRGAGGREKLTANRTYYVRTDGSDSNTGLVNNSGGAFLTIQKAIDTVAALDCSTYTPTIQIAAGTYTGGNTLRSFLGITGAVIIGDETTPANVVISTTSANCFYADGVVGTWHLRGMKLQAATAGIGIVSANGSVVKFQNLDFGACAFFHMQIYGYAAINASGNYSITGGALYHLLAYSAFFGAYGRTITLTGTPAWGTAGFECAQAGVVDLRAVTFSGAAAGKRYNVVSNGIIDTGGGGATFIPGNSAGTVATGGVHI